MDRIDEMREKLARIDGGAGTELEFLRDELSPLAALWKTLHALKQRIAQEKVAALADIDRRYAGELDSLTTKYSLLLRLARD